MAFSPYRGGVSLRSVSPDLTPTQIAARDAALAAQAAAETAQGLAETAKTDAETAETGAQAAEAAAVVAQGLAEDAQAAAELAEAGATAPTEEMVAARVGISIVDYPREGGETTDMPRFRRAVDVLETAGGGRLTVPWVAGGYEFAFESGSTIDDPTRILITTDNVEIIGLGMPTITMTGLTTTYLFSIDDYASSGRDIFTPFSFAGAANGLVDGFKFVGEYTGEEEFRYQSPRAIAVGFKGCTDCTARNIEGVNILGNTVNVVGSNILYDAPFSFSERVTTENITSTHCLENGVNYMGGTKKCVATNINSTLCANGLETGCEDFTGNALMLVGNRSSGLALAGKRSVINGVNATLSKRTVGGVPDPDKGYGLIITGGEDHQINGGKFNDNYANGIFIYPGVKDVQFNAPEIRRNAKDSTLKTSIQMVGTSVSRIQRITFNGGDLQCEGASTGSIVNYADDVKVTGMKGSFEDATNAFVFNAECSGSYCVDNQFGGKTVAMLDLTGAEGNNGSYRRLDRTSIPTTGTWLAGDIINNRARSQGSVAEWSCLTSGTFGTLNGGATTGSVTSGSKTLTVSSATGLGRGMFILIAGVSGVRKVTAIAGTTVTIDIAADATVSSAAVTYRNPVVIASRQNGPKTSVAAAPDFQGQLAVVGSVCYMATGTGLPSNWVQISNP